MKMKLAIVFLLAGLGFCSLGQSANSSAAAAELQQRLAACVTAAHFNAAMWGVFVAVLNFVPYFGPVAGIIVLATVGLLTFDTLWQATLPPAWYLLLHTLEANLLTPVLLGRRFTLNPVVLFVSLIFWTWLWGVPGALLSVPILVSIKVVCDRLPALSHVSEVLTS